MSRYYAAVQRADMPTPAIVAETATYDLAVGFHAGQLARATGLPSWRMAVLLDCGSLAEHDEPEWARLLATDPVLAAVFEMGRRAGSVDSVVQPRRYGW